MAFVKTYVQFPFCQVSSRAELPVGTLSAVTTDGYPIATTYEQFFEWIWRVRTWKADMTFSVSWTENYSADWADPDPPNDVLTGPWTASASCSDTGTLYSSPTIAQGDEQELVCTGATPGVSGSLSGEVTVADSYPDLSPGYNSTYSGSSLSAMAYTYPRWKTNASGSAWYPIARIHGTLYCSFFEVHYDSIYQTEDPNYIYSYQTVQFAGHNVQVQCRYFDWATFGSGDPDYSFSASFRLSLNIQPIEWFEYDPGDGGGPVWNSASGARLRDPFSII